MCAICGKPFVVECLLGKPVIPFKISFVKGELYAHAGKCVADVKYALEMAGQDEISEESKLDIFTSHLPDGPLRKVSEELIDDRRKEFSSE